MCSRSGISRPFRLLVNSRVLLVRLLQDWNLRVGILPLPEECLVLAPAFGVVAPHRVSPRQAHLRQRDQMRGGVGEPRLS